MQSGADVVVDIVGYFTDSTALVGGSGLFVALALGRALDTRPDSLVGYGGEKPARDAFVRVSVDSILKQPRSKFRSVVAALTITEAAGPGYVQAAPARGLVAGETSALNAERAEQTIAHGAIVSTSRGAFDIYTQGGGHLIADIYGWFTR